jgi:hypothetical protein
MAFSAVNADLLPRGGEKVAVKTWDLQNGLYMSRHRTTLLLNGLNLTCNLLLLGLGVDCGVKFLLTSCARHDEKDLVIIDNNVSKFDCSTAGAVINFVRLQYFAHDPSFTM